MEYTYVWHDKPRIICVLDIGTAWVGNARKISGCAGIYSTMNHPSDWASEYKKISFEEFSAITGVTIKDVLSVL